MFFGNIFKNKKRLMARIVGIQRSLDIKYDRALIKLDKKLQKELENVLYQQSREDWIKPGDRNTRFYHTSTLVKRSRNNIKALRDAKKN